ncbi:MAG TPA: sulfotransferase family protein [Nocardioidaceae bacterium]|nr:sulfotransferase family protein [Nocardioidaceae bacterium]
MAGPGSRGESATRAEYAGPPRLVVVVGSGRSGTSTLAGALKYLGMHVPQPEWPANRSNPRGFHEPKWVVQFQRRMLRRANIALDDARPAAFDLAAQAAGRARPQRELAEWLKEHALLTDTNLVKDPRNSYFVPMWRESVTQAGGVPSFLTMLRHPAEVVGSKSKYYGERFGAASRTANWLNIALHTEEATRDSPRTFVRYADLLQGWRGQVDRIDRGLGLTVLERAGAEQQAEVDGFIDPGLRRVQVTWDDLGVPRRLRDMAEHVWEQLGRLAASGDAHDADAETALDSARRDYRELYAEAEATVESSVYAAREQGRRAAQAGPGDQDRDTPGSGGGGTLERVRRKVSRTVQRAQAEG